MASPFHVFRKNQKAMIATLGLLAIGAFVFLTPIAMYWHPGKDDSNKAEDPVVVTTTKYGDLTRGEIGNMQADQRRLGKVFVDMFNMSPGRDGRGEAINELFGKTSEEDVVHEWLEAKRAKELGMKIDEQAISSFIFDMSDGKADGNALKKILGKYGLTNDQLYDLLRDKFLAKRMIADSFDISLFPKPYLSLNNNYGYSYDYCYRGTPGQCWDYFQRANRRVGLYFTEVKVEDWKKKVGKPTEEELVELFEKYKDKPEVPGSSEPSFLVPEKVEIEYIEVDPKLFAKVDLVTDEEVDEYYEKNKIHYPVRGVSETTEEKEPKATEGESKESTVEPDKGTTPEKSEGDKGPEGDKVETSAVTPSRFRLVSMQTEDPNTAEKTDAPEKSGEATPAADTKPAEGDKKPESEPKAAEGDKKPESEPKVAEGDKKPESEPKTTTVVEETRKGQDGFYDSIEDVKKEIREKLANDEDRLIEQALKELKKVRSEIKKERVEKIQKKEKVSPDAMKKKAEGHKGWGYDSTGLVDAKALLDHKVGRAVDGKSRIVYMAFDRSKMDKNDLKTAVGEEIEKGPDGEKEEKTKVFLLRKIEHVKPTVSSLDDPEVRKKVVEAWVEMKARAAAKKEADRLAEIAKKSGKWLSNSIKQDEGVTVMQTDDPLTPPKDRGFTWFLKPKQSEIAGFVVDVVESHRVPYIMEYVDSDFMRTVYGLKMKEIAVATDRAKNAYVVQLAFTAPDTKVLWEQFQRVPYDYYRAASRPDSEEAKKAWIKQLEKDAGLEWKRTPLLDDSRE